MRIYRENFGIMATTAMIVFEIMEDMTKRPGVDDDRCHVHAGGRVRRRTRSGPDGGVDPKKSEPRKYSSDLYYGAVTALPHRLVLGRLLSSMLHPKHRAA